MLSLYDEQIVFIMNTVRICVFHICNNRMTTHNDDEKERERKCICSEWFFFSLVACLFDSVLLKTTEHDAFRLDNMPGERNKTHIQ